MLLDLLHAENCRTLIKQVKQAVLISFIEFPLDFMAPVKKWAYKAEENKKIW
jgi:hypothetical protein